MSDAEESNLVSFARSELERAGQFGEGDFYGGMMGNAVLDLIKAFSEQGHSGMSAGMCVSMFERLARFEPLSPLTGSDDEWNEVTEGMFQNRRCSHVFKENGVAYDSEGKVFREPSGACFTSKDSRVEIEFPYVPKREYIDVEEAR